jgi:hypothetical protein
MAGLVPFAMLVSTVRTLRGATVVGDQITESPIEENEALFDPKGARPVIAVYVGNADMTPQGGRDMLESKTRQEIAFQIYLPESCKIEIDGSPVKLDTRGRAAEVVFASIWRQIMRALQDNTTPWSMAWNTFVCSIHQIVTHPFEFEIPGKVRGAAREIVMIVETADEPEYGLAEPYDYWQRFLDLLAAEKDYGPQIASLLRADICGSEALPSWRISQTSLGYSLEAARALGFTPFDETETGEPPLLEDIQADGLPLDAPITLNDGT